MLRCARFAQLLPRRVATLYGPGAATVPESFVLQARQISGPLWNPSNDPFRQLDRFVREIDRRMQYMMDNAFVRPFPFRSWLSDSSTCASTAQHETLGPAVDVSTKETYKLVFNCRGAKAEDISVTLKDKTLVVKVQVVTETEGSKLMRQIEHEQTIPEGVDISKLESSLSPDGELSIWAPKEPTDSPQTIRIQRE